MGYWGCAAGWGHIFMTGLTIVGSTFKTFSIELLERGHTFQDLKIKNHFPKSDEDGACNWPQNRPEID